MLNKVKIILDTDLGSDCDDAGALVVLHSLIKQKRAELLAVTHCTSEIGGAVTITALNEFFGHKNIPVGRFTEKAFLEDDICKRYTKIIMREYLEKHPFPQFEDSVKILRKYIANNSNITLVAIGPLNNIACFLRSKPDAISPFTGEELVRQNVREMYVMGGNFSDLSYAEYNIVCDVASAQYVADKFPKPIVYCGFELGAEILTGEKLKESGNENLLKKIYKLGTEDGLRPSWDPITVYCAVEQNNALFQKSPKMNISFDDKGRVSIKENGKDCWLELVAAKESVRDKIDTLMFWEEDENESSEIF